jgi:hypothetical protein
MPWCDISDNATFAARHHLAAAIGSLVNSQLPSQLDAASLALSRDALTQLE